jgi:ornithine decarboxylase
MNSDIDLSILTGILKDYNVQFYSLDMDIYSIINNFLDKDVHEEAFFIVDLGKIIRQYAKWKKFLPHVTPYYAVKCNPNPVIIDTLNLMGCSFDCASKNEISMVSELIEDSSKIIFANPIKICNHIQFARSADVDLMTFDSEEELYKIKLYHPYTSLVLRLAVDDSGSLIGFREKYGVTVDQVPSITRLVSALQLNLVGLSFHVGTGCKSSKLYQEALLMCRQVYDICLAQGINIRLIDIGGGFPGIDSAEINFEGIAGDINEAIETHFGKIKDICFIAEPGRFLVASSHTLVVNVIGKKVTFSSLGEKEFVYYINDGIYGSFNCVYFEKTVPDIQPYNERDGKRYKSKIFGPTCDSIDLVVREAFLPELCIGDWCLIESFGAYTTALASNFNGFTKTKNHYILTN